MSGYPMRYLARVTFEFTTPFHVGSGREGGVSDADVVRDMNGLPTIPGSSLAGVLRAALAERQGDAASDDVFGVAGNAGLASRLRVSWGVIHDANDRPAEGLLDPKLLTGDAVLGNALVPTLRDHVRINHRGASDAMGYAKFDELAVCAGHRFTCELELAGEEADAKVWGELVAILNNAATRLGGKTRRGFGAFRVVRLATACYDLSIAEGLAGYGAHPVRLAEPAPLAEVKSEAGVDLRTLTAMLTLEPRGYWMFGGGADLDGEADLAPVRDARVVWRDGRGTVLENILVIPGSAVKGALAHRVAYHYNALSGCFADEKTPGQLAECTGARNPAVRSFFGCVKNGGGAVSGAENGLKGRVIIDDWFMTPDPPAQLVNHVALDRFTGGARQGALFSERPLWRGEKWQLPVTICQPDEIKDDQTRQALVRTLGDLVGGRLALGGGTGRGNGYFTGTLSWSDGGAWARGEST